MTLYFDRPEEKQRIVVGVGREVKEHFNDE